MNKNNIIPIFVPHMGCPHDCIFCNQRKITNFKDVLNEKEIFDTIDKYLLYFKNKNIPVEIAFYGGSFTGLDEELMIKYLNIAKYYINLGKVSSIRLSTRPDYINKHILDILKIYNVKTIELGVQSLNDNVLRLNERGHGASCVYEASNLIKSYNITLGLQMMVGLYGDNFESCILTAYKIASLKPDFVRIYPTLTIKDTKLEQLFYSNKYIPMNMEDTIELCKYIYIIFDYYKIPIIRLGLQSSDNISENGDIIAGAYHPAFRELVESRIYREIFKYYINKFNIKENFNVTCANSEVSKVIGNKRENVVYLYRQHNLSLSTNIHFDDANILYLNGNRIDRYDFIDYYFAKKILRRINET